MFFMFGTFSIIMGTFVYFFIPETKGLSLESMDELFGVTDASPKKIDADMERGKTPSIREHEDVNRTQKGQNA
jgi:hypothetical protein